VLREKRWIIGAMRRLTPESRLPDDAGEPDLARVLDQLNTFHTDLLRDIEARRSWKLAFRNGVIGALGGIVASALFFAFAVRVFAPLNRIDSLKPILERIAEEDERSHPAR